MARHQIKEPDLPGSGVMRYSGTMNGTGLLRHVEAFRRPVLPGNRLRLFLAEHPVGWILPVHAAMFDGIGAEHRPDSIVMPDVATLRAAARVLSARGLFRWRDEEFDVRSEADDAVVAQLDRGALPRLGIRAAGVHINGVVMRPEGLHLWVARRRDDRPLDPGKLDHLAAGGIPAGLGPAETLVKEAHEEAGIPAALASGAEPVLTLEYTIERSEGLRRDRLYCYDLALPEEFQPAPHDNEVAGFELWPMARALQRVAETDDFKFNVNLALIDLFLRKGLVDPASELGRRLREGLDAGF
jgi:8-oxo-dGTP pyrophosphatase MutT (NUDIX family)